MSISKELSEDILNIKNKIDYTLNIIEKNTLNNEHDHILNEQLELLIKTIEKGT